MPVQLLSAAERDRANRFPRAITDEDLITFFTLSEEDRKQIPVHAGPHARLGFALELCALRFMGFVPEDLTSAPPDTVTFVARQLAVEPEVLARYTGSAHTRMHHRQTIQAYLGYRRTQRADMERLAAWLLERALEHETPTLLYALTCEQLQRARLVRPGVTQLERLVAETRQAAQAETFRRLGPILTEDCRHRLDALLEPDPTRGMTPLAWLRRPAISNSPRAILGNLEKLACLRATGVEHWPLEGLNPNRLKFLAQLARKSSAQALQRAPAARRYPILVAFLAQCLADVTDEVIEMFDRCLAEAYARAGRDLEAFRAAMAQATNEKVYLFRELVRAVLDPAIADPLCSAIIIFPRHERISPPQATQRTRNIALDTNLLNRDNRHEDNSSLRGTITMLTPLHRFRHVFQLASTLLTLIVDALRYLGLCLHPSSALAAENLFLRKQLALYQERHVNPRRATNATRIALVWFGRWFDWRPALAMVQPKTFIRWHRQAFRLLWRWKSRPGRPPIPLELQALIRRLSRENPTWGQERIANELLLKLGLRVSPRTVRKYLPTRLDRGPSQRMQSQRWSTFVRNQAKVILACDFCVVVTATFRFLYVFVVVEHASRRILHVNATAHPTAAWTLQQLRDAIPSNHTYGFLIHDRDSIFSQPLDQHIRHLGLRVLKTPVRRPQANALCERLLGTLRRECLDFVIPLTEHHLRHVLNEWVTHYNKGRPHMALGPGIPQPPPSWPVPRQTHRYRLPAAVARPILGGLHHEYRLEERAA